jgi:multicomponent Na+:H+ antiporter subunit D
VPELVPSLVPLAAVLVSLAAVPLILLSERRPNLRELWTLVAAFAKLGLVLALLPGALAGRVAQTRLLDLSPGVALELRADPLGVYFALVASALWVLTSFYSIGYVRGVGEKRQTRYFASFAVCLSATLGIAFSANLLTFLLFYEVLTVATYPLVVHKESREALAAGRKYLAFALSAGVALIAAVAWTHTLAGGLDFVAGGLLADVELDPAAGRALFLLFLGGVGVKAGLLPLQSWLPAAMVAPTPVSALLHAVAVVKSGVFGVVRVVGFVFGPDRMRELGLDLLLAGIAAATILLASLIAMNQDNLKARLAYSTIGHLSYIVLGVALLSPDGFAGGVFHLATHATMKITLFFCAGAIYVHLKKDRISQLDGVGRDMPWTMGAFTVGAAGLAGVPPVNGFLSKWFLCLGALEAGELWALGVFLTSGLLNAAYFFPIVQRAFFRPAVGETKGEASPLLVVPLVLCALASLALGVFPNGFLRLFDLARAVAASALGAGGLP